MNRSVYKLVSATSRWLWTTKPGRLRILCYHGICEDRLAKEPWMPAYFVAASAFEQQLDYLRDYAVVLPLADAVRMLREGGLPERAVSITFDDGYANNLHLAQPLLARYRAPATIMLSSAYIESGGMYPFLQLQLIRQMAPQWQSSLVSYKDHPVDEVLASAAPAWREVQSRLTADQVSTLRPLTVKEVQSANPRILKFGAHTHSHCILRNESPARRAEEIRMSVERVETWTRSKSPLFSYPNGEPGDFSDTDKQILREAGVTAAVTGIGGLNSPDCDPLALRRLPVGLYHDPTGFQVELSGLRSAALSWKRRLQG